MGTIRQGLRENKGQFALLVLVNAFVGGMVGIERTIFPQFAQEEFGLSSNLAILSFIAAFGISKALANFATGRLANQFGRKTLLLTGWILAFPIPFIFLFAPDWNWIVAANILLGISQGLTWSSTVVMKIDLVGEKDRGLAMGLNEFAGYLSVGLVALATGYLASTLGVRPYPFYLAIAIALIGLLTSWIWVNDTRSFVQKESQTSELPRLKHVFWDTTLRNPTLSSITQAGLVNNLNDGMIWGLLPIFLLSLSFNTVQTGWITGLYPIVWGLAQLFTGKMADSMAAKKLLFLGMLAQGLAILVLPVTTHFYGLISLSVLLGLGTALVYPTFLSTLARATHPIQRPESMGTFRLWRDLGYAFGALLSGLVADWLGVGPAIFLVGVITVASAILLQIRMPAVPAPAQECIEPEEVFKVLEGSGKYLILDVRSAEEYEASHLPNALHVPLPEITQKAASFDPSIPLITVCGSGGGRSAQAARQLKAMGFYVRWLCGGTVKGLTYS